MHFSLIAAVDLENGLGKNNTLPWHIPSDLKHFNKISSDVNTSGNINAVIMGRKTWESLPTKSKPLSNRLNVILTREENIDLPEGVLKASSLEEALKKINKQKNVENIFVIGGGKAFEEAIHHTECQKIYLTQIQKSFDCDAFFPKIDQKFILEQKSEMFKENDLEFQFLYFSKQK